MVVVVVVDDEASVALRFRNSRGLGVRRRETGGGWGSAAKPSTALKMGYIS